MHQNAWLGSNTSEMKRLDKDVSFQMHSFPSLFFFFFFFFLSFFLRWELIHFQRRTTLSNLFCLFSEKRSTLYREEFTPYGPREFFPLSFTVDPFSEGTCLAENKQEVAEIVSHVKMRKICQVYTVTVSQRLTILLTGLWPSKRLTGGKCHIIG